MEEVGMVKDEVKKKVSKGQINRVLSVRIQGLGFTQMYLLFLENIF